MALIANRPSLLDYKSTQFMIIDAPTDANLPLYIKELQKANVKHLVRVCDPTYSTEALEREGIQVHHWPFPDGHSPPDHILSSWLTLCRKVFKIEKNDEARETVAVHCVAGLGRAPVLVAVAFIEQGMDPYDAVEFIRSKRRGAINEKQLKWLETYKKKRRGKKGCVIM
mmetsp:Transcript_10863/g.19019  ORF Transcript_10863/g.19019 Transcript_10863/m.19019 type:complete len:169 (-) Transcript_10863:686-1192(-)